MGLRADLLEIPLDERLTYDPRARRFFVNFERLAIKTEEDIDGACARPSAPSLAPLGAKVDVDRQL